MSCSAGTGLTGNTELNVIVPNGAPALGGGSSAPGLIDIQSVEYTINCLGNDDRFLENNASFPDEVRVEGNLEVVDGRTNPGGNPPDFGPILPGDASEVWQAFMDLPPGPCTVQLRARDNDGEVICTATEAFSITADTTTKVNLILVCDVSFQAPVGMLDVDATFSFVVSNFCPDLFVLNCLDSEPAEQIVAPPPIPPVALTTCEVRFRDGDSTCGNSCDPQTCVVTPEGIDCTPGPDPGVSTTVTCVDDFGAGQIDCDFNSLTTETECVFTGDTLGATPVGGPIVPNAPGAGAFAAACTPPALGGTPGATLTCTAVTTDGDEDCNKTKVVAISCPGQTPCQEYAEDEGLNPTQNDADAACTAAAPSQICLESVCENPLGGAAGDCLGGACCTSAPVNEGGDCSSETWPVGICLSGVCEADDCTNDFQCDDGNPCTFDTCDLGVGICSNVAAPNEGNPCSASNCMPPGNLGFCAAGTCIPEDTCSDDADCPNVPAPPASPECTAGVCLQFSGCGAVCDVNLSRYVGGICDFSGPAIGDGICATTGECVPGPTWSEPEIIDNGTLNAFFPQVGVDDSGNVTAVWFEGAGPFDVWSSRLTSGADWGAPELIDTLDVGDTRLADVAVAANGNAVAVWRRSDGSGAFHIWAAGYSPDLGWGTAERIDPDDVGLESTLDVGVDSSGNAVAIYSKQPVGLSQYDYYIWANTYSPSAGWGTPELIDSEIDPTVTNASSNPRVAVDPSGNAVVVWEQLDLFVGAKYRVLTNRYTSGGGWGPPENLDVDGSYAQVQPHVDVNASGHAVAVWRQDDGSGSPESTLEVWSSEFSPGVGWGTAQLIGSQGFQAFDPQVAVGPDGTAIAVWGQKEVPIGSRQTIWANRRPPGGWGTAELISFDDGVWPEWDARVDFDAQGNAIAVWYYRAGTGVGFNRYTVNGGWGGPGLAEKPTTSSYGGIELAVHPNGNATIVWQQRVAPTLVSIWSARFE